jgi:hypothetical protein
MVILRVYLQHTHHLLFLLHPINKNVHLLIIEAEPPSYRRRFMRRIPVEPNSIFDLNSSNLNVVVTTYCKLHPPIVVQENLLRHSLIRAITRRLTIRQYLPVY